MNVDVFIPQQGLTTETVIILNWLIKVGDSVKESDIILETESEKAVLEVESPAAGVISKILYDVGDEVSIGETVAIIETE